MGASTTRPSTTTHNSPCTASPSTSIFFHHPPAANMKFSTSAVLAVLSASTAFAAPAAEPDVSMMTTSQWPIQNMKRTCGGGTCNWSFDINQNDGNAATACTFKVNGSPATQTDST